mgnify:CR=1 FL=1
MTGWHTAQQVLTEALAIYKGEKGIERYEEGLLYLSRCFRDYQLYHASSFVKVWLPVSAIRTVALPEDYMELVFVGISQNGEVFTFTRNDKIATPSAPLNDVIISDRNEDDDIEVNPFDGFASGGYNLYEYFTVNEKKKRIEFKQPALEYYGQSDTTEVLVGYIGTGLFDLNTSFVPAKAVNMITLDIAYNLAMSEPKKDWNHVQALKRMYDEAAIKFNMLNLPSADELLDVIYETSGQSIRR